MPKNKRIILLIALFVLVSCVTGYMLYNIVQTKKEHAAIKIIKQTLPNFTFYSLDSVATNNSFIKKGQAVCVFYFNADCEHCQYEAKEINKNIALFKNTQIVMVSFNTIVDIKKFANEYGLNFPNLTFLQDHKYEFKKWFGKTNVPAVFIYNAQHQLVKEYQGETKIEAIIRSLSSSSPLQ